MEADAAIACSDPEYLERGLEEVKMVYERLKKDSQFGEFWLANVRCSGWKIRPVERFSGPLGGNTSHPILLIGNTADPVTPLEAAKRMSPYFPGSVVLTQNSTGHCSLSAPSTCTAKYVREYFFSGKLPPAGEVCQEDYPMFSDPPSKDKMFAGTMSSEEEAERTLREVVWGMSEAYEAPLFGVRR